MKRQMPDLIRTATRGLVEEEGKAVNVTRECVPAVVGDPVLAVEEAAG